MERLKYGGLKILQPHIQRNQHADAPAQESKGPLEIVNVVENSIGFGDDDFSNEIK